MGALPEHTSLMRPTITLGEHTVQHWGHMSWQSWLSQGSLAWSGLKEALPCSNSCSDKNLAEQAAVPMPLPSVQSISSVCVCALNSILATVLTPGRVLFPVWGDGSSRRLSWAYLELFRTSGLGLDHLQVCMLRCCLNSKTHWREWILTALISSAHLGSFSVFTSTPGPVNSKLKQGELGLQISLLFLDRKFAFSIFSLPDISAWCFWGMNLGALERKLPDWFSEVMMGMLYMEALHNS